MVRLTPVRKGAKRCASRPTLSQLVLGGAPLLRRLSVRRHDLLHLVHHRNQAYVIRTKSCPGYALREMGSTAN